MGPKAEMDPELLMKKKFRAKCLFRALGRLVMANTYWLIEDIDHYEGLDDVKRRVQQAVRSKGKKKQLLTIKDKTLLNKPAEERTYEERKYIFRIIGGLKCFKRYPNHVKKKLAAVTYYKYFGPGRTIVRQHHEAHALYFIVSGDVTVSQVIFDELLQQHVSVDVGTMHSGDMFGEVSLLHNIPRTATVTTNGHCEMLALMKDDFKNVLQASIQKQWDEVRSAMSRFTYFDALDEVAQREGCIVAKMKTYEANETILGDGVGVANFVYFILSGQCQMIESLQMKVTTRLGKTFYTLHDPYIPKEESDQDFDTKYFGAYNKLNAESKMDHDEGIAKTGQEQLGSQTSKTSLSQNKKKESLLELPSISQTSKHQRISESSKSLRVSSLSKRSIRSERDAPDRTSVMSNKIELKEQEPAKHLLKPIQEGEQIRDRPSIRLSLIPETRSLIIPPPNLRTYFMQVVRFNPGSTFGFGENMRDRRIVALTPVKSLLLPKIWLLQRNTANIWTRIQHYLEKKIPTKKDLFKEFVSARRWTEFREQMVTDVVSRSNTVNWTSVHDVPYSIRMEEMLDI